MNTLPKRKPSRTAVIAFSLAIVSLLGRTLISTPNPELTPWYVGLHLAFAVLFALVLWQPALRPELLHLYFVIQSGIVLGLLALDPQLDIVTGLFVLLCYQVPLVFVGAARWTWVGICVVLTGGSLMFYHGLLPGLAFGLMPIAVGIVLATYVVVNEEIERARDESETLLDELQKTQQQLQAYAGQVEELAATEERNRLARELHDSVSQTIFSLILNTRTAQILLKQNPAQMKPQLEQLQTLAQNALAEMRGLITQLRPQKD